MEDDLNSYFNSDTVKENGDDDDVNMHTTVDGMNTIDNLLDLIEDHLKRAIKTLLQKRYVVDYDS